MEESIKIKNARIHNLQGIDVTIPRNRLTVITGVSGSGKSSLAFDTLYEEGKRRYLMFSETQFMIDSAPGFDSITGLSPTVAVEQRIIRQANPRSTVGTRVKLEHMLAILYANYGECEPEYQSGLPMDVSMFQRNSARGMCVRCLGKGVANCLDEEKLFSRPDQKICEIACDLGKRGSTRNMLDSFCREHGMDLWQTGVGELTGEQLQLLKYGDGGKSKFCGLIPWINMLVNGAVSTSGRLAHLLSQAGMLERRSCPRCGGTGLGEQASHTLFHGKTITELENMYIKDLYGFLSQYRGQNNSLLDEIVGKLECMMEVGLHHLALSRPLPTLSGGEVQRLFLASYIITELDSLVFVFDEPTIGLHESEKENLIRIIRKMVEHGNTVVAVEHDRNFMCAADYIIDLGPGAGMNGGRKIFEGTYEEFLGCPESRTAVYLRQENGFPIKRVFRPVSPKKMLTVQNASLHNLKNITASVPLGVMVGIAGVSGSGKSSLISDTLVPLLKEKLKSKCVAGEQEEADEAKKEQDADSLSSFERSGTVLRGWEQIKRCYIIDQKPIGRSRTSCPATYAGIFDRIRALFAEAEESVNRGYTAGMFTVNSKGGCHRCKGDGVIHYHVGFGNFIDIECEECGGTGYLPEVMEIRVDSRNIRDILEMSVDEAREFFEGKDKGITQVLEILQRVGMGYIKLGQATPTISGGESQRIKLAKELARGQGIKSITGANEAITKGASAAKGLSNTLYILDEPTTGLAFADEEKLLALLNELVDCGASVLVTEHDPFILSNCDYILEMGEGGGGEGGKLIAEGTPEELRKNTKSIIGRYLK